MYFDLKQLLRASMINSSHLTLGNKVYKYILQNDHMS